MPQKSINLESIVSRIAAVAAGGVLFAILLLGASWFFGSAVAGTADTIDLAEFAQSIVPGDPKSHLATSLLYENSFRAEDLNKALKEAEIAVSLSPRDYMLWQTVARLRERAGNVAGAEAALRKSFELAPNNAAVQWALGNVLLRRDKTDEAFAFIRKAVESDSKFVSPAASIAWDFFEGDMGKVKSAIGASNAVKASLAVYLARQERLEEGLEIWNSIPQAVRRTGHQTEGNELLASLMKGQRFVNAMSVAGDLVGAESSKPNVGKVTNGNFEADIPKEKTSVFDWSIEAGTIPSVGVSVEKKRSGQKSLALLFDGGPKKGFRSVSQTIAVESGKSYTFSVAYSSDLASDATLVWQIVNAKDGSLIAATDAVEKSGGWSVLTAGFTVPAETDGVIIRLARAACTQQSCPIQGTVWFDDVEVK